jgi:Outer membrane protein beta-barrel domain
MKTRRAIFLVLSAIVLLSVSRRATAQDRGDAGISMGYPATIGLVFHVSERFALRPEVNFNRSTSERDSTFVDYDSKSSAFEIGISGLCYVGRWDKVRAYVSPRYAYRRAESSVSASALDLPDLDLPGLGIPDTQTTTFTGHTFGGSFGAQISLHERFSVFGEAGISFSTQQVASGFSPSDSDSKAVGSRTAVGVVFYF